MEWVNRIPREAHMEFVSGTLEEVISTIIDVIRTPYTESVYEAKLRLTSDVEKNQMSGKKKKQKVKITP